LKEGYRLLGEYIRQVDVRNTEGKEENLLGVSVQKQFIPSIANTVGTDFTKYKVVKKGQFTYIPDTSRRGDKIGIALLQDYEEGLVSNVYTVFEVVDTEKLLPEYLMLWFSRPEFDRYARFKSHGSVREVLDWDEMCKVELPVPTIDEQKNIVKAYKAITDRITLKKQINDNLASQALAYYKLTVRNCSENEIIEGSVGDIGEFVRGKNITAAEMIDGNIPVISAGLLPSGMHNAYNVKGPSITVSGSGVNAGYVSFHQNDIWAADCSYNNSSKFIHCLYVILKDIQSQITELQKGTAQPHVYPKELNPFAIKYPEESLMIKLEESLKAFFTMIEENNSEIKALQEIQTHFLSVLSR